VKALHRFAEARQVPGLFLEVTAPLPPLAVGVGSLARRPGRGRLRAGTVVERRLRVGDPPRQVGTLLVAVAESSAAAALPSAAPSAPAVEAAGTGMARLLEMALRGSIAHVEARASADRLEALDEATRAIAGVLSTERVLQLIVDSVRRLVGAEYAALGIVDTGRRLDPFITSGMSRAARDRIGSPPRGRGLLGAILDGGSPIRVDDITADPRRHGFPPNHPLMRGFLGVPISLRGRAIGNLYLTDKSRSDPVSPGVFTPEDQRLVELFASHAGIAIENARLHEKEQQLAVLEERQRIGRDLHDGIIQSIYAVGLTLDDAYETIDEAPSEAQAKIERAIESLNLTIRDIRNFIFGLQPEPFDQAGLVDALAAMAEEFRVNTMVEIGLDVTGSSDVELSADATLQLLHLTREALSNVARHARAHRAEVRLDVGDSMLEIAVVDDGVGFDPTARRGPGHMGISNMRARAAELDAEFLVESAAGRGTRVLVRVPISDVAPPTGSPTVG
jgi:signal transduction histidine kinase